MPKKTMYLNRILADNIKVHPAAYDNADVFGLEMELEGRGLGVNDLETIMFFTKHDDQSLRKIREDSESLEYVFTEPLDYMNTMRAVKLLFNYLNSDKSEVFESYRTSIHVHVNCAKETFRTVYNYILLSIIFDELFVSQNGAHRAGNNFCLRTKDAQAQLFDLIDLIQNSGHFFGIQGNHRYSSVNYASLIKFGTIEFRSMECTTDFKRVKHWVDTLQQLKVASRQFQSPKEIISLYSKGTPDEFIGTMLGASAPFYRNVFNWQQMVQGGMRLAQDFAYCSDWVSTDKPSGKVLEPKIAKQHFILQNMIHNQQLADAALHLPVPGGVVPVNGPGPGHWVQVPDAPHWVIEPIEPPPNPVFDPEDDDDDVMEIIMAELDDEDNEEENF